LRAAPRGVCARARRAAASSEGRAATRTAGAQCAVRARHLPQRHAGRRCATPLHAASGGAQHLCSGAACCHARAAALRCRRWQHLGAAQWCRCCGARAAAASARLVDRGEERTLRADTLLQGQRDTRRVQRRECGGAHATGGVRATPCRACARRRAVRARDAAVRSCTRGLGGPRCPPLPSPLASPDSALCIDPPVPLPLYSSSPPLRAHPSRAPAAARDPHVRARETKRVSKT
jgi:hypothetical protein